MNCLQCFCCRLFGNTSSAFGTAIGFGDWSKLNPRVHAHEDSAGHREALSSTENTGSFLELVKFLGNYDPVVREHLTRIQSQPNTLSYLSPAIQNDFISILGQHVLEKILEEVREAKYYSIMFDSTPDLAHDDQMSQVLRYVKISSGNVEVKETFLCLIKFEKKGAEALTNLILAKLKEDNLNVQDMLGQGYDNATTMAGIHSGVQRRILDVNKLAIYIPCNNHSLNLAGVHSAQASFNAITFFDTLDRLFAFFSTSTHR
ncbi:Zinc finger MYM-type protein 1-like [Oopsacas minuta]|uniref:Zinc finger MYM-type protein 1-like n=1 Tax=Oopsacas minuta TaxID=111878 RepID=A0AAV7JIL4_9METZ|nr:Zinc finger MYM-type protein 1-like [Oopsacas minuta]